MEGAASVLIKRWTHPQHQLNLTSSSSSSSNPNRLQSSHRFTVKGFGLEAHHVSNQKKRQRLVRVRPCSMMLHGNPIVSDLYATGISVSLAFSLLRLWEETAKRRVFDQKLNRKLVHITVGLAFILCWPFFSASYRGVFLAALAPGVNIIRMLLIGSGMWKDDATVKSMSRYGDHRLLLCYILLSSMQLFLVVVSSQSFLLQIPRELLKGPLYYAATITFASVFYWRTSPIAIAAVCNLCAGDGMADVVGRRFGTVKLPYNQNKSVAGSVTMAVSGFLASLGFMHYFASFGFVQESWEMVLGFFVVSLAAALVESLPISTKLDDNLTVTLTSLAIGNLIF